MASPHARTHLPGTTAKPPDSPPEAVSAQVNTRTAPLSRTAQCSLTRSVRTRGRQQSDEVKRASTNNRADGQRSVVAVWYNMLCSHEHCGLP